jgi:hypothetical protein
VSQKINAYLVKLSFKFTSTNAFATFLGYRAFVHGIDIDELNLDFLECCLNA